MPSALSGEKTALLENAHTKELQNELTVLISMALQVSLSTFARIALTSIDAAFLGHLGTRELAASSLASIWTSVPLVGVWAGASALITLCGQAWGARNGFLTGIWLQIGLLVTSILTIPVFIWYWCVGYVLAISTADVDVVRLGTRFARILSLSIWPSLMYACIRLYLQSMGIMAPTTIVGILSICVAIGANYFLIYGGIRGWEGLGFDGSPLATVVASWFQPLALISYAILYKQMHLQAWGGWNRKALTIDRFRIFIKMSGPVAANSFISNLATSAMSLIAAILGSNVIAANAVIGGLWSLLWALFWGFGCATQVRVANHLGANRPQAAKKATILGFGCTLVCVFALAMLTHFSNNRIFEIYTNDKTILQLCMHVKPLLILGSMLQSMEVLMAAVLTGMGQVQVPAWTSSLSTWFVELPIAYIGAVVLDWGFLAMWYAVVVMESIKLAAYAYTLRYIDWQAMAWNAMATMEVSSDNEADLQREAMNYAIAESETTPMNANVLTPNQVHPLLLTPSRRRSRCSIDEGTRQRGYKRNNSFSHA
uniref:Multidrug/Oligosaccharidyllipid/Polysaccharide (MOP) Flippase Superfamily putative n=1 Tax=Albugo laibachii Nc14 TaxID=890382 RepID=F0WGL8_9STRA|nr:Multidrug/Oligosaccharidyllipid/Polysaccharide (MOP) Flippase Superfamily putative [Albugo laibachii Nc14]|eukprot:CCA20382.1 Multidrug/Oligosaccharidyllipid/Polysaccharide (MOP) Flippase Superfamily putative [Albugo laibachii Nc14]